jgi:FkbM family methyltransferase
MSGALRRLLERPPVEYVVATVLRSSVVTERTRFVARELVRRGGVARYRVRESGRPVFIRHGSADVPTLDEVFYRRDYEPPQHVAARFGASPRVVDLGANIGLFGVFALGRLGATSIVSVEPLPENVAVLRRCAEANGGDGTWTIVEAAATTEDGTASFVRQEFTRSYVGPGGETVAAVDAFVHAAGAGLVKIDIEGGEWAILGDSRLRDLDARVIVLEYHPEHCPEASPRAAAERLLREGGYATEIGSELDDMHGILWAWRPESELNAGVRRARGS